MAENKLMTLPITGMTCANCVAAVERNLKKVDGVATANVNLSSERATVEFDPARAALPDLVARVERAGYGVAAGEADLAIRRLSDDNDARRLEKALAGMEGVLEAQVSFATERARVRYIPTILSQADLRKAVASAGFEALETGGEAEDAEAVARQKEIDQQRRLLTVGLLFTVPLFVISMARDFGLLPMSIAHAWWIHWLFFALPPRCSSTLAGNITWAPTNRCATARLTWTCWWRWAVQRLIFIPFPSRWAGWKGTPISKPRRSSSH